MTAPFDLDALEALARSVGEHHRERGSFGGVSWEFHARAQTLLAADVPALVAELRAARAQIAALRDVATGKIQHTFTFACGSDVGDPECPACRAMGET